VDLSSPGRRRVVVYRRHDDALVDTEALILMKTVYPLGTMGMEIRTSGVMNTHPGRVGSGWDGLPLNADMDGLRGMLLTSVSS
jgi:hypothetical protein